MKRLPKALFDECPEKTVKVHPGLSVKLYTAPETDEFLGFYAAQGRIGNDGIPFFAILWDATLELARHLATAAGNLKGRRIIELGCGLGLPSIVAASRGAEVTATDFHPDCGRFLKRNAAANGVEIAFRRLDWGKVPARTSKYDLVVASDVIYDVEHLPDFVRAACRLCRPDGAIVVADPGRRWMREMVRRMRELGWAAREKKSRGVHIFEFRAAGAQIAHHTVARGRGNPAEPRTDARGRSKAGKTAG